MLFRSIGEDKDIIALAKEEDDAVVQVFFIRDGRLIGREHFFMTNVLEQANEEILDSFIKQFYSGTPYLPKNILLSDLCNDLELITEWLSTRRGSKVTIQVPQKGEKEKLVDLAKKNANLVLSQDKERMKREEGRTIGAVKEISSLLELDTIHRIEIGRAHV